MSTASEMDRYLPGGPSKVLIRRVRNHLKRHGIIPIERQWKLAWEWADAVAMSYFLPGRKRITKSWPQTREIASQYLVILLAHVQKEQDFKLPFRATKMTAAVAAALPSKLPEALRLADDRALAEAENEPITIPAVVTVPALTLEAVS